MLPTRSQFQDVRQSGELWARQHGIQGSSILNWGRSRFVVHHLIRCLKYVELGSTSRFFFWPRFLARKLLCMCMCMWYHRMWCMWKWIGALLCQGIDIRFIIILRKAFLEIFFWVFTDVSLKDTFWNILTGAARTLLIPSGAITHGEWSSGSLKLIWCWGKTERAGGVWRWIKEAQIYTLICICLPLLSTCSPTNQGWGRRRIVQSFVNKWGVWLRGVWGAKWGVMCMLFIFQWCSHEVNMNIQCSAVVALY